MSEHLEQERMLLDDRIAVVRQEMENILTERNMKTLIHAKLSAEILYNIFLFVKSPGSYWTVWLPSTAHVCRYWRSITLSRPSFWASGFPRNVDGMRAFLERSNGLPISLYHNNIDIMWSRRKELQPLIFSNFGRLHELRIDVPGNPQDTAACLRGLDTDMPHLRVLHLTFLEERSAFLMAQADTAPYILFPRPENLRHIRDLRLHRCGLDWNTVELRNLTALSLTGQFPPNLRTSVQRILDVLRRKPELEILVLDNVIIEGTRDEVIAATDISLSKLNTLEIYGNGTKLAEALILSNILQKLQRIVIEVSIEDERTMTSLIVAAARLVNHLTPFIVDIREDAVDLTSVPSRFTFSYAWDSEPYAKETFQFVNTWNGNHNIDLPQAALLCMKELNLEDLERFVCLIRRDLSKEWWRTMLDRASDLGGLYTERLQNPGALMHALTPDSIDDHESDSELSVFLPSLNLVSFANTVFARSPSRGRSTSTTNISYEEGSLMHLINCLRLRKEHKHRLDLLQLPGTKEDNQDFSTLLRQYVDTVFYLGNKGVDDAMDGWDEDASDYEQGY